MLNLRRLAKLWIVGVIAVPAVIYWLHVQTELGRLHRRNQRSLDLAARQIEGKVANALTTVENLALDGSYLCEFIKTQPYLTLASQADCRSLESRLSFDASDCQPASAASLRLTSPRPIVELPTNSQPELLRFEVDLERLLRDAPFEDVFGNLFIADAKGAVVAAVETKLRLRRGGLRLRSLDQLGLGESRVAFADLQRVAGASPVALTGGAFRLYTQPLTLPARAPDGDASPDPAWVLGALVAEDVLMADALALPTHLVWLLFLLPIVGALSWPLLRLLLLHPRERLRFTEAYWLLLSTSATAMLGVLLLLQFDSYRHQRRQSFERLERLADGIETGLSLEFLTLRDYLDRSTPKLRTEALRLETASSETWEKTGIPGFRQMVLIDERGCQIFKTRSSGRNTPNVSVSQREYFQAPMENRLWEGEGRGFFVQSFRSITTGEFASSLTIRLGEEEGRGIVPPPTVAAVSFKPVTVTDPVLRPGYGFAIIDEGGGIIYHSDAQRALHETIFEETEEARRLEGLLYALQVTRDGGGPSSLHLDLDYRTRPHLLAVRAMKEPLPWLIATFQEKRLPATLNAEIVAHALVFCGIYFVIVNGVPALVCIFFLRRRMEWAWPAPAKISLYRSRILLLLGPLVLLAAAAVGLSGWGLLFSALLIPALALPMLILNYIRWSSRGSKDSRSSNYIAWNVAGLAVLFVVLSMLPAYAFYKLSWQGHQAILAFYEREEMRRAGGRAAGSNADAPSIVQLQDGFPDEEPGFADDWTYPRWPQFIVNLLPVYNDDIAKLRSVPVLRSALAQSPPIGWASGWGGALLLVALAFWLRWGIRRLFFVKYREIAADRAVAYSAAAASSGAVSQALVAAGRAEGDVEGDPARRRLWLELKSDPQVEKLFLARRPNWSPPTEQAAVEAVLEAAEPYYRELWDDCSLDEELTLVHLREEGVVNPKQRRSVESLLRKGLLRWGTSLELFNQSFSEFVGRVCGRDQVRQWERPSGFTWRQWRALLATAMLAVLGFLFFTQRGFFDSVIGFLSAAAAATPLLLRLLSGIGGPAKGGAGGSDG